MRVSIFSGEVHPFIDKEGVATGIRVAVAGDRPPLFLVHGLQGSAVSTLHSTPVFMYPGQNVTVNLAGSEYALRASGRLLESGPVGSSPVSDYKLELVAPGSSRTLIARERVFEEIPEILWLGDVDGDRKLDLLINTQPHYNVSMNVLYLSSQAIDKEIVFPGVRFSCTGC